MIHGSTTVLIITEQLSSQVSKVCGIHNEIFGFRVYDYYLGLYSEPGLASHVALL